MIPLLNTLWLYQGMPGKGDVHRVISTSSIQIITISERMGGQIDFSWLGPVALFNRDFKPIV